MNFTRQNVNNAVPVLRSLFWVYLNRVPFFAVVMFLSVTQVFAQTSPGGVLTSAACRLWVDAGDVNGDGDYTNNPALGASISSWEDKSGNNNDLAQGTATNRPTYNTVAGRSVVRFDNSGSNLQWLIAANQTTLNPGTMYLVIRMLDAGDGGNTLWDRPAAGNTSMRFEQWNNTGVLGYTKYGTSDYTTSIPSTTGSNLVVSYLKASGSDNVDIAVNSSSTNLTVSSANPGLPLFNLGKNSTVDGLNGYVLEALCYNTNLNYAQKMIVDNYLSAKHGGITIISDKYAGDTGGNGNYDFELGGVGTEASGSNNSASSSVTGGLEATQATAMGNGEYLMYAHQATPINSVNTTDVGGMTGAGTLGRWERIWYFDWTHVGGSNESVNLVFDYSDAGVGGSPAAPASNYKLLYRSGTSGNWTEVMNASSLSGDRVTFNGVAWNTAGDGYYTLGSSNTAVSPLPVTLLNFTAVVCATEACVNWSTLTENNSRVFKVQRSVDGAEWSTIAEVQAKGFSRKRLDYEVIDRDPRTGVSYYRLVSEDFDGSVEYSHVVSLFYQMEEVVLSVFPNPASEQINIEFTGLAVPPVFGLMNAEGRFVEMRITQTSSGSFASDVRALARGMYVFVAVLPDGTRLTRKIVLR